MTPDVRLHHEALEATEQNFAHLAAGGRLHFPYSVYFEFRDKACVVWAIAHGRRRPGYWKGRP